MFIENHKQGMIHLTKKKRYMNSIDEQMLLRVVFPVRCI